MDTESLDTVYGAIELRWASEGVSLSYSIATSAEPEHQADQVHRHDPARGP